MDDHGTANNNEFEVDIERGRCEREDGGGYVHVEDQANLVDSGVDSVESMVIDLKLEDMDSAERKVVKEKRNKMSNKKASKPPRPPRGPSLDSADQKLIREIAELAMLKRIRTERSKVMKKMKAVKTSSSSSNSLFTMIFTIIFCLVILLQGISTRSSSNPSLGASPSSSSPEPDLITVQYGRIATQTDSKMSWPHRNRGMMCKWYTYMCAIMSENRKKSNSVSVYSSIGCSRRELKRGTYVLKMARQATLFLRLLLTLISKEINFA